MIEINLGKKILINDDCLNALKEMPDGSIDSIVTDPPYGLSFMGKKWDYEVPNKEIFSEMLRVLKPGGHMLCACGTRTQHRMAVNIEDAGFEIRDVITWLYGSGFPKSMDISKAIDKAAGAEREIVGQVKKSGGNSRVFQSEDKTTAGFHFETSPSTDSAKKWQGWGTALKPACEFWTLARKPLSEKTVAANVLKHGTGGINIDGCRVECSNKAKFPAGVISKTENNFGNGKGLYEDRPRTEDKNPQGRWPANLILDEEAAEVLDEQSGTLKSGRLNRANITAQNKTYGDRPKEMTGEYEASEGGASRFFYVAKASKSERNKGLDHMPKHEQLDFKGKRLECLNCGKRTMIGSTFACGCDSPNPQWIEEIKQIREGNQNNHPTVKPVKLMTYLCRLITPRNGIVLDPFMGSGSTGVAAIKEGFGFIGIEREKQYFEICQERIGNA